MIALVLAMAGVLGATWSRRLPFPFGIDVAGPLLLCGLAAGVVFASWRGRPTGLLKFHWTDLIVGVFFGLTLRVAQGWLTNANTLSFPVAVAGSDGSLTPWMLAQALPAVVFGPVLEEFFFRAVIAVSTYQLLRKRVGSAAAGFTAVLVSAGLFVLIHACVAPLSLASSVQLFFLGAVCCCLLFATARVWGAVLAHATYNGSYVLLMIIGSMMS